MKVFYKGRKHRTNAVGEYDQKTGELIVKKGSIVSETIAPFPGAQKVKELRNKAVDDKGIVNKDISFKTPSAAAAFVTGYSANGLLSWHVEKHITLRDALQKSDQ